MSGLEVLALLLGLAVVTLPVWLPRRLLRLAGAAWLFAAALPALRAALDSSSVALPWLASACLGALGWYFYWIAAGTGIYLYLFFDTGIEAAYSSVEYMTNDQWYAAGVMRSLHRYASDALVVVVVLHILREFSLDRMRGKRFFTWVTGVPVLPSAKVRFVP